MSKVYDWPAIRHRYVSGTESIRDLAAIDAMPHHRTLAARSSKEDWPAQRAAYQQQVAIKTRDKASTLQAEVAARHARMAQAMQGKALEALKLVDPTKLTAYQLVRFLEAAANIERKALQMDDTPTYGTLNTDSLTLDQLKRIAAGEDLHAILTD